MHRWRKCAEVRGTCRPQEAVLWIWLWMWMWIAPGERCAAAGGTEDRDSPHNLKWPQPSGKARSCGREQGKGRARGVEGREEVDVMLIVLSVGVDVDVGVDADSSHHSSSLPIENELHRAQPVPHSGCTTPRDPTATCPTKLFTPNTSGNTLSCPTAHGLAHPPRWLCASWTTTPSSTWQSSRSAYERVPDLRVRAGNK